jgi:flagella basal body P-ring formation protein FlgA
VSSRGQAQQSGSVGEMISVLNPQSKRTVHAVVTGPGRVEVSAAPTTVAAAPTGQTSKVTP